MVLLLVVPAEGVMDTKGLASRTFRSGRRSGCIFFGARALGTTGRVLRTLLAALAIFRACLAAFLAFLNALRASLYWALTCRARFRANSACFCASAARRTN